MKNVGPKHPINQNDRKGSFRIQKSCKYCGKIHDENIVCNKKPIKRKKIDDIVRFRNSPWLQKKRKHIKGRDSIHINVDGGLKLNENNLITLCSYYYRLCNDGEIT